MRPETTPSNPHLRDLFRTALGDSVDKLNDGKPSPPHIVVNGSNNVLSWGGVVHIQHQDGASDAGLDPPR